VIFSKFAYVQYVCGNGNLVPCKSQWY